MPSSLSGLDQEVLAAHGCRTSPRTGLRVAPSASMLDRLGKLLNADELEAALSAAVAAAALDPAIPAAYAAHRADEQRAKEEKQKKRKPPAAASFRGERGDGWFRAHPLHPWLDPAVTGDPGHVPARRAVAVDGKERKGAKAGGQKKVHLLAAVTHVPGLVIAQDKDAEIRQGQRALIFPVCSGRCCGWRAPPGPSSSVCAAGHASVSAVRASAGWPVRLQELTGCGVRIVVPDHGDDIIGVDHGPSGLALKFDQAVRANFHTGQPLVLGHRESDRPDPAHEHRNRPGLTDEGLEQGAHRLAGH